MLSGPILPEMLRFSLPLMATYLMDIAFFAADKMVAGQCVGSSALAAVSASGPVLNLLVALFNGFAVGTTVTVARHIGAKNPLAAEQAVHTAAVFGGIISRVVLMLGMILCKPLLAMLSTPADIFEQAATYFRIRIAGLSIDLIYKFCSGTLRAVGETKKPLLFSAIAGILNVGLNFLLVAGFHMGVAGLAIATDASNLTCLVCVLVFQLHTDGPCKIELPKLRLCKNELWNIVRIGLPAGVQSSCFSVSNAFIQSAINSLGTAAIAGVAAANTFNGISDCATQAADHSATTFASQNFGARQLGRIWKIAGTSVLMAAIIVLPLAAVFAVFGRSLLTIFISPSDPNFEQAVRVGMVHIYMLDGFKLLHVMMATGGSILRSLQKPWLPMFAVIFGSVILRVLWITFIFPLHPSALMIFICYPITWALTSIFNYSALAKVLKQYKKSPYLPTT